MVSAVSQYTRPREYRTPRPDVWRKVSTPRVSFPRSQPSRVCCAKIQAWDESNHLHFFFNKDTSTSQCVVSVGCACAWQGLTACGYMQVRATPGVCKPASGRVVACERADVRCALFTGRADRAGTKQLGARSGSTRCTERVRHVCAICAFLPQVQDLDVQATVRLRRTQGPAR